MIRKKPFLNQKYIKNIVKNAMKEDLYPNGDVTSQQINSKKKIKAKIISNQAAIIGGLTLQKKLLKTQIKKLILKQKQKTVEK